MIATLCSYFLLNLTLFYVYRACVTVVEHFGRIRYPLDLYGAVKPEECSSVDWQESEMLNGFKISYNPSQQRYDVYVFSIIYVKLFVQATATTVL